MGTNVRRPMIHKILPNLILRPPGRRQNLSLGINPIEIAEPCYPHDNIVDSHLCGECKKLIWPIVCGRLVSIKWQIAQVCWRNIECQVHQFVPCTNISRFFFEHTFDKSPIDSSSSFLIWWSSKQTHETLCNCSTFLFASSQNLSMHFLSISFHVVAPHKSFGVFSHPGNFSVAVAEMRDSHILSLFANYSSVRFAFTLSASPIHVVKTWCWLVKINIFHQYLSHESRILFLSSHCDVIHVYQQEQSFIFQWTKRHSQFGTYSHPGPNRISSNSLSHTWPASVYPYKFRSRGSPWPSIVSHGLGHLCRGRRIQKSGHSCSVVSPNRAPTEFSRIAIHLNRPAKGWPYKFLSRGTTGSSMFDHDFGHLCLGRCEGGGDVVGVVTPLVGGVAQAFHDDQVVELRVQLGVQEVEGKEEEDREGQVEVEEEKRLKEVRSWMTMEMFVTRLRSWANEVWDDITECTRVRALCELSVSCAPRKHLCKCRHWCTCCSLWALCNVCCCCCWCCSWSHAWSHCSCCCCRFRRSHIA